MAADTIVPGRLRTDVAAVTVLVIAVVAGALLMAGSIFWSHHDGPETWVALLRELGALLVVTGALSVLWDLHGRRALTAEVLDAAGLSSEVQQAGLERITDDYLSIDYAGHFAGARKVDLFFAYAHTWRATHASALRTFVGLDCARLRVILPDPDDAAVVAQLAERFGYTAEHMASQIRLAADDMHGLAKQKDPKATVEVRFTKQYPVFTSYRFDDVCVAVMYAQVSGRDPSVPAIEARGGRLFRFFDDQFEGLWAASGGPSAMPTKIVG